MKMSLPLIIVFFVGVSIFVITPAFAHVSEQGFVLLLPTDFYITTGCLAVAASIAIVSLFSDRRVEKIFQPIANTVEVSEFSKRTKIQSVTSLLSLIFLIGLIVVGVVGTRDPLTNILPLTIWTVWWVVIVMLHCVIGNLWNWINPWTGAYALIFGSEKRVPLIVLSERVGVWPAIILFIGFSAFSIADPAPDDPARLANIVLAYLIFTFAGMIVFGSRSWLRQVEFLTLFFSFAAKLSPAQISISHKSFALGIPGWKAFQIPLVSISQAIFILMLLGCGSFDGLNETFWWLAKIGVNPLEFPGRSAVITPSVIGLVGMNLLLLTVFAFCVWLGVWLAESNKSAITIAKVKTLFCALVISLLPIAFAYHGSHYLVSFLVNGQYVIAAISDPLAVGANYLQLEEYQVTTGFLNTQESVRKIWLSQAILVVVGHILAVLMAHAAISNNYPSKRDALYCHIPIAIFMTAYTWFGLWLLAVPRGV